jgi:polygalacturonase
MKDVPIPIAISPYYTNQTVEPFEDPKYEGAEIPDYKSITLKNIFSETAGDVLIAGLDDQHRTQVTLENVYIRGLLPAQVHLNYVDLSVSGDANKALSTGLVHFANQTVQIHLGQNVMDAAGNDPCAGKFVPMQ